MRVTDDNRLVDLGKLASTEGAIQWWSDLTERGLDRSSVGQIEHKGQEHAVPRRPGLLPKVYDESIPFYSRHCFLQQGSEFCIALLPHLDQACLCFTHSVRQ